MAKNKRGRAYKMTPRRKAALRKAQLASARKRRRRVIAIGASVGATLAVGAAGYALTKRRKSAPVAKPGNSLVHVPGLGVTHTEAKRTVIPKGWGVVPGGDNRMRIRGIRRTDKHVFKTNSKGVTTSTTKKRVAYDTNRRRAYWRAKPVGGAPRKKYTSSKRGRR